MQQPFLYVFRGDAGQNIEQKPGRIHITRRTTRLMVQESFDGQEVRRRLWARSFVSFKSELQTQPRNYGSNQKSINGLQFGDTFFIAKFKDQTLYGSWWSSRCRPGADTARTISALKGQIWDKPRYVWQTKPTKWAWEKIFDFNQISTHKRGWSPEQAKLAFHEFFGWGQSHCETLYRILQRSKRTAGCKQAGLIIVLERRISRELRADQRETAAAECWDPSNPPVEGEHSRAAI